ncbi:MAG: hypothetical protein ISQ63_01310 [SAR86 cluster bacterium]|uniref:Lipoprotein n=1 Tax=SAR86 cluster bacterium TaxID=2030880 RepID=A0A937LFG9_9GAMM|nr:hypothetical protein [SAR86 cluster bacterium]
MNPKYLINIFVLTLFACGGGGTGNPAASPSGSASSANATILYSPATQCTLTSISSSLTNFPDTSNACNQPLSATMKTILAANMNNPISTFTDSQFYYTSDLSSSIQTQLRTAIDDAAAIFGHFDLYFFGIGSDLNAFNSSVKQNFCDAFGYATCGSDGTLQYLINIANGTTPNDAGANTIGFNPNDSKTPPKKAYSIYQGLNNADALETIAIHEYYHIYQHATTIGMSNESNIRKMPPWYSEGTAQYVAEWLAREKGYAESTDNFETKMGQLWDEAIVAYGNGTRVKDGEQYPINNPLSVWAVAFMIEKATARSGITNGVQEILITIPNQVNEKGWYKTFQDNTGITLETFYTQFNSALSANDKSTRVSNLVTSNFASTVTGKYNYSVLQLTGADTSVNSGGTPSAAARTLYFYDNDTSTIPSYQGGYSGAWPYVVTSKNITKATEISASITKNVNGNYVLVANKPVYQYASDTTSSKSGATINLWKAIKPDGTGVDGAKIAP